MNDLKSHLEDYSAAAQEAVMEAEEVRRYASSGRVGARKYRLEGSVAGNSKLVYKRTAEKLRAMYGGTIVNMRPRQPSKYIEAARELGPCPRCKMPAGVACRAGSGRRAPHAGRPRR